MAACGTNARTTAWRRLAVDAQLVEWGCNYVPEVRAVEWRDGCGVMRDDALVAREFAAARMEDPLPSDWCSKEEASAAPKTGRSSFYERSPDERVCFRALDSDSAAIYIYASLISSMRDHSIRVTGRRSAHRVWNVLRRGSPDLPPWPWETDADAFMDEEDAATLNLHHAKRGLDKAKGKAERAALRIESMDKRDDENALKERVVHWNARVAERQERMRMASEKAAHARASVAALPSRIISMTRRAEALAELNVCKRSDDGTVVEATTVSTSSLLSEEHESSSLTLFALEPTRIKGCHWEFELVAYDEAARSGILVAGTAWD